jgi:hypothetical protein
LYPFFPTIIAIGSVSRRNRDLASPSGISLEEAEGHLYLRLEVDWLPKE